jgi:hypothetical protein
MMFSKQWAKATFERTLGTGAAAWIALIGADGSNVLTVPADAYASVIGGAMLVTVLKCVVAANLGTSGPGFGSAESLTE